MIDTSSRDQSGSAVEFGKEKGWGQKRGCQSTTSLSWKLDCGLFLQTFRLGSWIRTTPPAFLGLQLVEVLLSLQNRLGG